MLQTLLASGALFSGVKAEVRARAQRFGFMLACAVVALLFLFVGLLTLAAAAAIALEPLLGLPGAVSVVGGGAILIGVAVLLVAMTRKAPAPAAAEPAASPLEAPLAGIAESAAQQPVPWLVGALALGLLLGSRS